MKGFFISYQYVAKFQNNTFIDTQIWIQTYVVSYRNNKYFCNPKGHNNSEDYGNIAEIPKLQVVSNLACHRFLRYKLNWKFSHKFYFYFFIFFSVIYLDYHLLKILCITLPSHSDTPLLL
jgi:hypothetical protein